MSRGALVVAARELRAYGERPFAWLLGGLALIPIGLHLSLRTFSYVQAKASPEVAAELELDVHTLLLAPFFEFSAFVLLLLIPLWSMRLFSEERRQGTMPLLLSAPVRPVEIVAGKYLGILAYFSLFLVVLAGLPGVLFFVGNPDPGSFLLGLLGLWLLGAAMLAVGTLGSAMTDNGLVAAALTLSLLVVLLLLGMVDDPGRVDPVSTALRGLGVWGQAGRMWSGLLQLSDIVGSLGTTLFFLSWAVLRVDAATWR